MRLLVLVRYCTPAHRFLHVVCAGVASLHAADNVRVTRVGDAEHADAEVAAARRAELDVRAAVVVHTDASKVSVVLDLRAHQRRAVARDKNELRLAAAQCLERLVQAKAVLATLHHKLKARVHAVLCCALLRDDHCVCFWLWRREQSPKSK